MIHSFKRQTSAGATTPNSRRRCSTPACSAVSSLTAPFCNSRAH
jgi:hypothetical protein